MDWYSFVAGMVITLFVEVMFLRTIGRFVNRRMDKEEAK